MNTLRATRKFRLGVSAILTVLISMSAALAAEAQTVTIEWTRQFGGALNDIGREVAVDANGNVYIAGDTDGLPGEPKAGGIDAFVRKYTSGGALIWSRTFGTAGDEIVGLNATGLALGPDALYVAGFTNGSFPGYTNAGAFDAFLAKYDLAGGHVWTIQFGTDGLDDLHDVAVDSDKAIYVAGSTDRALPGQTWAGDFDAVLRKYNSDGTIAWTRQLGTSAFDHPVGIAFGGTGVYLVGNTAGAWPGFTNAGTVDALVLRFTRDGELEWVRQFGTPLQDIATDVVADGGGVYVVGGVNGALPGQTFAGARDVFVRKFNPGGQEKWTVQFGTAGVDIAFGVASGRTLVIGGQVSGALPGQTYSGGTRDAFLRGYDTRTGDLLWTHQFGTAGFDTAGDVWTLGPDGALYISGLTDRALPGQTHAGMIDAFLMRLVVGE